MSVEVEYIVNPTIPKTFSPYFNGSYQDYTSNYFNNYVGDLKDVLNMNSGTVRNNNSLMAYWDTNGYQGTNANNLTWWQKKDLYQRIYDNNKINILANTHLEFGFNELATPTQKGWITGLETSLGIGLGLFGVGLGVDIYNNLSKKNDDRLRKIAMGSKLSGLAISSINSISTYNNFKNLYNTGSSVEKLVGMSGMTKTIGLGGTTIGGMLIADGFFNLYKNLKSDNPSKAKTISASLEMVGGGLSLYSGIQALTNPLATQSFITSTAMTTTTINGASVGTSYSIALNKTISNSLSAGLNPISNLGLIGLIGGLIGVASLGVYSLIKTKKKNGFKLGTKLKKKKKGFSP